MTERFWNKVDLRDNGGCWLWTASTDKHGYGQFVLNKRMRKAHQVAYEELVGTVPSGLELDHRCGNPACVNPRHLEPVTHEVNLQRRVRKNRNNTSGHRNVIWEKRFRRWVVRVTAGGVVHHGGSFTDIAEAARAAAQLRAELHQ